MLLHMKSFLQSRPVANLKQIADELSVDTETARMMLKRWICKGRVRCLSEGGGCGADACGGCQVECSPASELYCWV